MAAAPNAALRWPLSGPSALLFLCLEHGFAPEGAARADIFYDEAGGHEQQCETHQ